MGEHWEPHNISSSPERLFNGLLKATSLLGAMRSLLITWGSSWGHGMAPLVGFTSNAGGSHQHQRVATPFTTLTGTQSTPEPCLGSLPYTDLTAAFPTAAQTLQGHPSTAQQSWWPQEGCSRMPCCMGCPTLLPVQSSGDEQLDPCPSLLALACLHLPPRLHLQGLLHKTRWQLSPLQSPNAGGGWFCWA